MKELFEELMSAAQKSARQICRDDRDLLDALPLQGEGREPAAADMDKEDNIQALRDYAERQSVTRSLSERRLPSGSSAEQPPAGPEAQPMAAAASADAGPVSNAAGTGGSNADLVSSGNTGNTTGDNAPSLVSYSRSSIRPKKPIAGPMTREKTAAAMEHANQPPAAQTPDNIPPAAKKAGAEPMDKNDVEELKQRMDRLETLLLETLEVFK